LGPGADIGKRAQPVNAGGRPEIDEDDFSAQRRRRQRRRIEPLVRALERGQPGLTGKLAKGKPMQERDPQPRRRHRRAHGDVPRDDRKRSSDCDGEHRGYQELVCFHRRMLLRRRKRSAVMNSSGMMKMPITDAAIMPPNTGVPTAWRVIAPAPWATTSGTRP